MSGQPCAWDSPTAYRYCYTHKVWTATVADVCPVAAEVEALRAVRACGMPYDQCRFAERDRP